MRLLAAPSTSADLAGALARKIIAYPIDAEERRNFGGHSIARRPSYAILTILVTASRSATSNRDTLASFQLAEDFEATPPDGNPQSLGYPIGESFDK
jgi:hypothetical protein